METEANGLNWLSISEIARQRGVTKQAIAKRVARLEALGAIETRPGPGGVKLVNIAAFDFAVGEVGDAIRTMNAATPARAAASNPILAREQARRVSYQAEIAKLDLEERLKCLLPADEVWEAIETCEAAMLHRVDRLPDCAEALAQAIGERGAPGARAFLKTMTRDLRPKMADDLTKLVAAGAAAHAAEAHAAP
ncbi:MarR family transcriptional regulator [Methylocella silvestris]|nr:MarR family transcriptional regulator [Methylocella silvestris]